LRLYEQAAANAPSRGKDRALIFREWALLLRDSGSAEATDLAIEKFEIALSETPNDPITIFNLARMYERKGAYRRVITLLEPLATHPSDKARRLALPVLVTAYERAGDRLKAVELRDRMSEQL
jgi:tetratricopeptide (TPR) repeat protein